jgi:hypothetical protein
MKFRTLIVCFAVIGGLGAARGATAQSLTLRIDNGLVTLEATNVTVDEILARWTSVTGLSVVSKSGAGSDAPVTLRLSGVSEREALQTILRDLSGYIMGERRDPQTGLVSVDRLLILPQSGSQAPATPASRLAPVGRRSPFVRGTPPPAAIIEPAFVEPPSENDVPVELAPAPGRSGSTPAGRLIGSGPGAVLDLTGGGERNPDPNDDAVPEAPTAPASPFGNSRGTVRPGEMTPQVPAEVQPQIIRSRSGGPPPTTPEPPPEQGR